MRPSLAVIGSALLVASSAELLAPSSSTSDPTITPAPEVPIELFKKQNDDRFMGWISVSGSYTSRRCDLGGTYYQSGDFWRCCATTVAGCNVPIGCVGGSLVYSFADATGTQPTIGTYAWYVYNVYIYGRKPMTNVCRCKVLRSTRMRRTVHSPYAIPASCTKTPKTLIREQTSSVESAL